MWSSEVESVGEECFRAVVTYLSGSVPPRFCDSYLLEKDTPQQQQTIIAVPPRSNGTRTLFQTTGLLSD